MLAYTYKAYGGPEVLTLQDMPLPAPKSGEVLIKVLATTVSAGDWRARSLDLPRGMKLIGRLFFGITAPKRQVLGTELSGVVAAVGADVTRFREGDAVVAYRGAEFGAHAEFVTMPEDGRIIPKPASLSIEEAAAMSFGGTTAYDFLVNKGKVRAGEHVLVNGASGATGSVFVQLAAHFGAEVTAVASEANAGLVRRLGASHVIDYKTQDFTAEGQRYDMIIDTVGTAPWSRARKALVRGGRLVVVSGGLGDMLFAPLRARLSGKRAIVGVAQESVETMRKIAALAEAGSFRPVIDRVYPFDQMRAAHAHVDSRRKKGNVVVTVAAEAARLIA